MLRLSFIVPFYNVEPYIEECIRSLYNQDIPQEDYEVICIDDCSPDGSRAIVERLQQEYSTLKLLRTPENLRQGGARNMGLDIAQGKYIWFVDSDDYIEDNCLGNLLEVMEKESLEVLHFDYKELIQEKIYPYLREDINETVCKGEDYFCDTTRAFWGTRCAEVWRRICLRELLVANKLRFVEKQRYEDTDYSIRLLHYVNRMKHIDYAPYIYCRNPSSTTHIKESPVIVKEGIQLLVRCLIAISEYSDQNAKRDVEVYIQNQATCWRKCIRDLSFLEKLEFCLNMMPIKLKILHPYITWRTLLAFKFGICLY